MLWRNVPCSSHEKDSHSVCRVHPKYNSHSLCHVIYRQAWLKKESHHISLQRTASYQISLQKSTVSLVQDIQSIHSLKNWGKIIKAWENQPKWRLKKQAINIGQWNSPWEFKHRKQEKERWKVGTLGETESRPSSLVTRGVGRHQVVILERQRELGIRSIC